LQETVKKSARSGNYFAYNDYDPVIVMGCRTIPTDLSGGNWHSLNALSVACLHVP